MTGDRDWLSYECAFANVLEATSVLPSASMPVTDAVGRYLARPFAALADSPAFDNSAVDGYGVRVSDLANASSARPMALRLAGAVRPGEAPPDLPLEPGTTIRILTGAPVPHGVEAVVMQEQVRAAGPTVSFCTPADPGANIRRQGEEHVEGTALGEPGALCTPALIALAAASGHSQLVVHGTPSVAIVGTGDELVPPGSQLGPGQIWQSNVIGLAAGLRCLGTPVETYYAKDTEGGVRSALCEALSRTDVVLTSGGVSVGDRDYVKSACESLGVERCFWGVRLKPGGPFYFGTRGPKLIFGLPGNPVSALVTFFLFARPALLKMMGCRNLPSPHMARLAESISSRAGRMEFVRGKLSSIGSEFQTTPIRARGSHMLGGLAIADCLILLPDQEGTIEAGASVMVLPLQWSNL